MARHRLHVVTPHQLHEREVVHIPQLHHHVPEEPPRQPAQAQHAAHELGVALVRGPGLAQQHHGARGGRGDHDEVRRVLRGPGAHHHAELLLELGRDLHADPLPDVAEVLLDGGLLAVRHHHDGPPPLADHRDGQLPQQGRDLVVPAQHEEVALLHDPRLPLLEVGELAADGVDHQPRDDDEEHHTHQRVARAQQLVHPRVLYHGVRARVDHQRPRLPRARGPVPHVPVPVPVLVRLDDVHPAQDVEQRGSDHHHQAHRDEQEVEGRLPARHDGVNAVLEAVVPREALDAPLLGHHGHAGVLVGVDDQPPRRLEQPRGGRAQVLRGLDPEVHVGGHPRGHHHHGLLGGVARAVLHGHGLVGPPERVPRVGGLGIVARGLEIICPRTAPGSQLGPKGIGDGGEPRPAGRPGGVAVDLAGPLAVHGREAPGGGQARVGELPRGAALMGHGPGGPTSRVIAVQLFDVEGCVPTQPGAPMQPLQAGRVHVGLPCLHVRGMAPQRGGGEGPVGLVSDVHDFGRDPCEPIALDEDVHSLPRRPHALLALEHEGVVGRVGAVGRPPPKPFTLEGRGLLPSLLLDGGMG
mmetsp:Transcript_65462/g.206895  ORF Transcript_65462/g.206895 Transcript_65462/m.206895 type:complete len:581 (+) Transcript_65462:1703-3445(+)